MKIERAISEILFNDINPQHIINYMINNYFNKDMIDFTTFHRSSLDRFQGYSMNEVEKIYVGLKNKKIDFNNPKTFFEYLGEFLDKILVYNEYEPKIKYDKLMRWNKIAHLLGQDLLTMTFLAYHDYRYNDVTDFFAFRSVIITNNRQLHNILESGMAENHFHLKGSSQNFCLNWISLMNHPHNRNKEFKKLSMSLKPYNNYNYETGYKMSDLIKIATILRIHFFELTNLTFADGNKKKEDVDQWFIDFNNKLIKKEFIFDEIFTKFEEIKDKYGFKANDDLDYALLGNISKNNKTNNFVLVGERKLIYSSVRMMLANKFTTLECKFFYLYILIKNNFRRELIQVNSIYGFSNFSDYERRKELFIFKYKKYQKALLDMAILDTLNNSQIISLEARITPKNSVLENIMYVKKLDKAFKKDEKLKNKMFYVFHFIKKKETEKDNLNYFCRNYKVRKEIEYQSKCLARCLEANLGFRDRVKGIDACNNEYHCRPEVFGQCFRFFSKFHAIKSGRTEQVPIEIFKTYHVGEDFLDITDGLRAIDEAVLFLNLDRGSRLGHATVLGIDVEEYYKNKDRIEMSKIDFIDNMVWLLSKSEYYNIDLSKYPCCLRLKSKCFQFIDDVYGIEFNDTRLSDYFKSWKLRGDNPDRYNSDGTMKEKNIIKSYDQYELNTWIDNSSRTKIACKFYYLYHFDEGVKQRGKDLFDFKIVNDYKKLLTEVQKKMRFDIARRGVFIECNPTSNYLIANLKRYEKHPIVTFYNYELYNGNDAECAQINVSINTDDQGVFDTSLENEYALMAYALENAEDSNGLMFTPNQVYKWIESVRKMGIQQKFK